MNSEQVKEVNYIVTTQGFSGRKVTECATLEEAEEAWMDCSLGSLRTITSPTGQKRPEWSIPY